MEQIQIADIIDIANLQQMQDLFSEATGVASIITTTEGIPITQPSNFCTLCSDVIRKTEKGLANCILSDAELGKRNIGGPRIQPCLSGGLWDAGVSINIGGLHVANWLIGQVKNETQDLNSMMEYADLIGADRDEFLAALNNVPEMSEKQFKKVAIMLSAFANEITEKAHSNYLLKQTIEIKKKREEELFQEKILMQALMDNIPDHIYFKDRQSRFIRISQSQARIFQLDDPSKIIGKSDFDFFSEEHASGAFNDEQTIIKEDITISIEEKETWPDRPDTWVSTTKAPLRDPNGSIIGTFGISRDITKRKLFEQELIESEAKLSTLFESMTEMVVIHELVFNEQGEAINYRITSCNNAFTNITGIKKDDANGKLATEVYQTETPPYLEEYSRVALSGESYYYATYFAPMDKHFIISVVSPRKNSFATITTDITEQKQIQDEIIAKKNELENYLYIASHDLRSPMVNIQGFSQRLQKQSDAIRAIVAGLQLDAETKGDLEKIINEGVPKTLNFILSNVTKMDSLINGLLQISRTGRIKMNIQKIEMKKLLKTIITGINFQLTEISAKVILNDLPECCGDENQLNQLFSNIISNALKYRDKNRQLVIEISGSSRYNKAIYCIKDTGIGIAPQYLDKIWDVFFRVDSSTEAGEGIGLSLAKRIVDKNKGKIWVESEEGKGSAFFIELNKKEFTE